jgi:hypothetical protein
MMNWEKNVESAVAYFNMLFHGGMRITMKNLIQDK